MENFLIFSLISLKHDFENNDFDVLVVQVCLRMSLRRYRHLKILIYMKEVRFTNQTQTFVYASCFTCLTRGMSP